ncbi:MAG: glycosyltransferase [Synergistes sp.]|nr:glycosyltransferase [Synergistes sp.]
MKEKTVSFIVPAYNAEGCIKKCLSSFVFNDGTAADEIEVIVVNDGSKDGTEDTAAEYVSKYPGTFTLINKKNGGHGSAINTAVQTARGRYIKVVDADDWVLTGNLPGYISALSAAEADAVITHFHTVDMMSGRRTAITSAGVAFGRNYSMEELMKAGKDALRCCMFHGITYRTDFYRSCGLTLSEGISYEDQEYCTLPFMDAGTIMFLDLFLYEYLIGSADQSTSDRNQVARAWQLKKVFDNILRSYTARKESLSGAAKEYLLYKLAETQQNYYITMLIRSDDRAAGRAAAAEMRKSTKSAAPELDKATRSRYSIIYMLHIAGVKMRHLEMLKKSPLYLWLRTAIR